jgi:hypothetical protein
MGSFFCYVSFSRANALKIKNLIKPEYRSVYKIYDCKINENGNTRCMFDDVERTEEVPRNDDDSRSGDGRSNGGGYIPHCVRNRAAVASAFSLKAHTVIP